jgi:predicted MPP superfamily phosphohydrolase
MQPRRRRRIGRFLVILVGITTLIQIPTLLVIAELLARVHVPQPLFVTFGGLVAATGAFFARFRPGRGDRPGGKIARHLVDLPYFVHWCASFVFAPLCVPVGLGGVAWSAASGHGARLPEDLLPLLWLACVALALYGVHVRRRRAVVRRREIRVAGLPAAFEGYRIVQLSDLHVGSLTPVAWLDRWVEQANAADADLAVVTGDLISSGDAWLDATARALGRLRAKGGVVVSLGNHDYFGSTDVLVAALVREGLEVLRNRGRVLARGDGRLWLAGVDDTWQGRDDLPASLAERPPGTPTILLAHDPKLWRQAIVHGVELTLSGHTHGAQLGLPWANHLWNLAKLNEPWSLGEYRSGRAVLYVHAGLGTTGPPARWGVAPEIAVLTLRSA